MNNVTLFMVWGLSCVFDRLKQKNLSDIVYDSVRTAQ